MKVKYRNQKFEVEFEGEKQHSIIEQIASFQEVFEENQCGNCKSENIAFVVRKNGKNKFYELHCRECHHKADLGTRQEDLTMYVKRLEVDSKGKAVKKDDKVVRKGKNGWYKSLYVNAEEQS